MSNVVGGSTTRGIPRYQKGLISWRQHNVLADAIEQPPATPTGDTSTGGNGGGFWAKITENQQDSGGRFRWFYGWQQVYKTPGYDGWTIDPNGFKGTASDEKSRAYNCLEAMNGAAGLTGIGVNIDDLPDGFDLQPISTGAIVWMRGIAVTGGVVEHWFSAPNGVNGSCSTSDDGDGDVDGGGA